MRTGKPGHEADVHSCVGTSLDDRGENPHVCRPLTPSFRLEVPETLEPDYSTMPPDVNETLQSPFQEPSPFGGPINPHQWRHHGQQDPHPRARVAQFEHPGYDLPATDLEKGAQIRAQARASA